MHPWPRRSHQRSRESGRVEIRKARVNTGSENRGPACKTRTAATEVADRPADLRRGRQTLQGLSRLTAGGRRSASTDPHRFTLRSRGRRMRTPAAAGGRGQLGTVAPPARMRLIKPEQKLGGSGWALRVGHLVKEAVRSSSSLPQHWFWVLIKIPDSRFPIPSDVGTPENLYINHPQVILM